jgi:CheY-like chemotaxis protein/anti-sigma regulatory factor (Ser/Thr protein kinase)
MVEMLGRSLGPTIEISMEFESNVAPTRVDPNQLELAILNLALNARDAMPRGGQLTISARRAQVAEGEIPGLAAGDYICVAESDTGDGMDELTLKRASEPFFTTKGTGQGTGLGLSMVDGLVAQSGGAMRIQSEIGVGTTVELWLPVSDGKPTERPRTAAARRVDGVRPCRVLLVDDDPIVASGTAAMLEDLGHVAIDVSSGAQALELLAGDPEIDLVITDHAMPGMTGGELALAIKRRWPALPVALVSGYAELPGDLHPDLPRLAKPYKQEDLARLMALLLAQAMAPGRVQPPLAVSSAAE